MRSLVLVLMLAAQESAAEFRIAGYLPDYRAAEFSPEQARHLTDLIVFSAEPTADGGLNLDRLKRVPWDQLRVFKTQSRVRLILCVGGWERSKEFATVAASDEKRAAFVKAAVKVCLDQRLDGLDLDWEHPKNATEEKGYGELLRDLHAAFRPHGLLLSITMAGWQKLTPEAIAAVDFVQLMAYDHDGKHSTMDAAKADVKRTLDAKVPAGKIVLGLPFYGRHVSKRDTVLTYRQIVAKHAPAADVDEIEGLYFNGPVTIRAKTEFARQSHLGGVMVWELGQNADGAKSLLKQIHDTVTSRK